MKIASKIVLLSSMSLLGLACGGKSPQQVLSDIKGESHQVQDQLALAGNWDSQCNTVLPTGVASAAKTVGIDTGSSKEEYHFADDSKTFSRKTFVFSDPSCQTPVWVVEQSGTVNPQGTTKVQEGLPVQYHYDTVTILPSTAEMANKFNTLKVCGHTDYQANQNTNVSNNSTSAFCLVDKVPRDNFDFVQKQADNKLLFSTDGEVKDPSKVPTAVDNKYTFIKQ